MKNYQLRHENSSIDPTSCLPSNRCNLVISVLALALLGALNFWWFLLQENESLLFSAKPPSAAHATFCNSRSMGTKSCNIFKGKWVPDPSPPPYTNDTCPYIFPNQDCMTNGRPDRGFIHWKWQPHACDIPAFDPELFLRLMTGKSMLFVGDSLARNQMQSLLCLIAQVETPEDRRPQPEQESMETYVWSFPSYNFTLALAWSPFLVHYTVEDGIWKIHVDRPDERWASTLANYDIAVFNTLYWFFRRSIYYAKGESISEYDPASVTSIEEVLVMKHVWSSVWKYVVENYEGIAVLRSASVSHFDGNPWDKGGTCYKTQPDFDPHRNMSLPWIDNEILKIQKTEFRKAVERAESSNSACRLRLLEVTYSTFLRPDGHPGAYRIQNPTQPRNDCTHWCMPGPIDSWNQLLFADPQIMCS